MRSGVMEAGEAEDEGRLVMVFGWWWGSGG